MPHVRSRRLAGLALFVLTCAVYARSPGNGFIWDDPQYVVENPTLRSVGGLWSIWAEPAATPQYYPMVHSTFWVEAHLWGQTRAAGYHVDNVLLHAAAAVLLWRAFVVLAVPWAWVAAAVFAVHPVAVESVEWVTERKNVLSICFYLLAFHAYRRFLAFPPFSGGPEGRAGSRGDARPSVPPLNGEPRRWYAASLSLFLVALLSKTVTCSLPAAILLVAYWKRGRITRADVRPLVPMFAVGAAMAAVTGHLERSRVGATGRLFDFTPADRLLIAGRAAWFYAAKVAWPADLLFMYPRWAIDRHQLWQWAFPVAAIGVLAVLFGLRRWIGRGPVVAVLFFAGTLTPALGFVNVYPMRYSFVADHFQYLAMIGLIPLLVAAVAALPGDGRFRPIVAVLLLAPLAWLTWRQQSIYRDAETLWTDTTRRNPASWMARINLATALRTRDQMASADELDRLAFRMNPDVPDTNFVMGVMAARREDWPAATAAFRRAVEIGPEVPAPWASLAHVLWSHGAGPSDQVAAVEYARHAVELDGSAVDARRVLGEYAEATGDWAGGVAQYERILAVVDPGVERPTDPAAAAGFHDHLGTCLLNAGRPADAAGEFARSTTLLPDRSNSWAGYGAAAARAGRPAEAVAALRRALQLDPGNGAAQRELARVGG